MDTSPGKVEKNQKKKQASHTCKTIVALMHPFTGGNGRDSVLFKTLPSAAESAGADETSHRGIDT
jgi:fido (protein-threonine AMPylation protein)